ncbi:hypothetical protein [Pteropox virus]|uniref:Uncharacterized protein n=1 Tax=Pteropox virus TaxID=1873698 RepID=A0A1B1MRP0_9POXV|nr:hypothetical protein [Pteropox virus]ANS71219.1 hypothetical protein [Pteropox virus]
MTTESLEGCSPMEWIDYGEIFPELKNESTTITEHNQEVNLDLDTINIVDQSKSRVVVLNKNINEQKSLRITIDIEEINRVNN